jgi:hypothetical protein
MSNLPPTSPDVGRMMAEAMQKQMPSCKTQAQFTAFMTSFDAFRLLMDSVFSANPQREAECREVFEKSVKAAKDVTEIGAKFEEIPIENRGKASNPFTQPPNEYHEYDIQKRLLTDLQGIDNWEQLQGWYASTKDLRDRIVTQPLRNGLLDQIRAKRNALQPKEEGN